MHAVPTLFAHAAWRPAAHDASPDLETPIGALATTARVDDHALRPEAAVCYADGDGARLWVWDGGVFRAELLRARASAGEVALWRLDAHERPAECTIECRWRASVEAAEAPADPARGVRRWQGDGWRVQLAAPARDGATHAAGDALVVSAPLERGARFETRFVVGWSPVTADWPTPDDAAERVLARLGTP